MTSIIRPVSYHQMMRVSRNDIYWNMKEIFGCVDKVGRLRSKSLFGNVTNPFNDDEKKKNEEENAKKLKQAVKDIEQCYNKLKSGKNSMERLYNRKVIPYENMDDTYKSKAKNIYYRYSNAGEQIKTFLGNLGSGIKNLAEGFIKGFSSTVYSGIVGIVFLVGGLVGHGCNLVFGDSPDFLKPCEDGVSNFFQGVKDFIHDPTTLIDNIGQSVNDTYEEKGLAYLTGSLLGDAAGMYALGKLGNIGEYEARANGVSKGSFLDDLRINDKSTFKDIMGNLKDLTRDNSVYLSSNGAGEFDRLLKSNKNLRDLVNKINVLDLTEAEKGSISRVLANSDFKDLRELKKFIDGGDTEDILGCIREYESTETKNLITDGSHICDGKLKPNSVYKTGEHDYIYKTNEDGLIINAKANKLELKNHGGRLKHDSNTLGKLEGDHAGHLLADRFGGSPELDNLVSQAKRVNLSEYKVIENQWAKALEKGQKVTVDITVNYLAGNERPISFDVFYTIDGIPFFQKITQ